MSLNNHICRIQVVNATSVEITYKSARKSVYFAHPYHSWERGANENMNGLIRQYLQVTEAYVQQIQQQLNNRPRKSLGYLTPKEYALAKFGIVVT